MKRVGEGQKERQTKGFFHAYSFLFLIFGLYLKKRFSKSHQ
ncbi:hypothetical protein HMPREF1403_00297 [Helicobacter pylori GAM201Ai]|nr:hypothetical protein HMPREF1403_00297 [Helicobacter pylori GAM201Ai]